MAAISMTEMQSVRVTVGVDTHKDSHVARAKDQLGRGLGQITVPACLRGYAELLGGHGASERSIPSAWRAPAAMGPG